MLPSRLDLGKKRYGGPFTVEQVENVKVFFNILKVLVSLGSLFAIERSSDILQPIFSTHLSGQSSFSMGNIVSLDLLPMLLSVILLILCCNLTPPRF